MLKLRIAEAKSIPININELLPTNQAKEVWVHQQTNNQRKNEHPFIK